VDLDGKEVEEEALFLLDFYKYKVEFLWILP
jgi:hypothetical protein